MFDGVLTTDTFVLGWHKDGDRLVFEVEASLLPSHPEYRPPGPGEWTCYRAARLVFDGVSATDGLPSSAVTPPYADTDGSRDFGSLNELATEPGVYRLDTDFGIVRIHARSARLEFT